MTSRPFWKPQNALPPASLSENTEAGPVCTAAIGPAKAETPENYLGGFCKNNSGSLEVPVVVFGDDGLADDIRGTRAREEVVVLVAVR